MEIKYVCISKKIQTILLWVWKSNLKLEKSSKFNEKYDISSENSGILQTRVDIFLAFFMERHPKVFEMTSVVGNFEKTSVGGQNLGKTSIVGEEIKKFTKSAENFTKG